jgi:hypothetical protein
MNTATLTPPPATDARSARYRESLESSLKVNWRIEDIIGGSKTLDFTRPFLPETLARVHGMEFLSEGEKLTLNQIRGNTYLCMFGLVEEFILPFVMDHARPHLSDDDWKTRALLQFASEEAKHIHLFKRFKEEFAKGFGVDCGIIGPAEEIARGVLSHHPLSVALTVLHIEWMTQRHYVDAVKEEAALDPQFMSLLKHHWMEEAQHSKLDALMVESLGERCTREEIAAALDGYLSIGGMLDAGLAQQVRLDMDAFQRATGRALSEKEQEAFTAEQLQANRWTYLGSGMTHPKFLESVGRLMEGAREKIEAVSPVFV